MFRVAFFFAIAAGGIAAWTSRPVDGITTRRSKTLVREFNFVYEASVDIPAETKDARLWAPSPADAPEMFLKPNRLVPVGGPIADEAATVLRDKRFPERQARALYEHLTRTTRYDGTAAGSGRGDALRICDLRSGNCSDKHDFFYGALDEHRIEFTVGRDIQLVPKPAPEPRNYFIYPVAMIDGQTIEDVDWTILFMDAEG